jgi:hypothetical protein
MSEKEVPLPSTPLKDEEAAAWVVRLDSDQRTRQDEARFSDWLEEDDHNAGRFEEVLDTWNDLGALKGNSQAHAILGTLYETGPPGTQDDTNKRSRWSVGRPRYGDPDTGNIQRHGARDYVGEWSGLLRCST